MTHIKKWTFQFLTFSLAEWALHNEVNMQTFKVFKKLHYITTTYPSVKLIGFYATCNQEVFALNAFWHERPIVLTDFISPGWNTIPFYLSFVIIGERARTKKEEGRIQGMRGLGGGGFQEEVPWFHLVKMLQFLRKKFPIYIPIKVALSMALLFPPNLSIGKSEFQR